MLMESCNICSFVCLILHDIMSLRFTREVACARISFLFMAKYVSTTFCLSVHLLMGIRMSPPFGYCE